MLPLLTLLLWPAWAQDPFERWPEHAANGGFGSAIGISVADVDGDGWTDVIVSRSHVVWRNTEGRGWEAIDVPYFATLGNRQYGVSFADYNRDGLPDLVTEPRGSNARLLRNEGAGVFTLVPYIQFVPPVSYQQAETAGWADVDGDGWLDVFVPAYDGRSGLWHNFGPDDDGLFTFDEVAWEAGLELNRTGGLKPEGAQFVDVDRDGDADLYVCGELFRNESSPGEPRFLVDATAGLVAAFDEGAAFADIDMDGDFDLGVLYHATWESEHPPMAMLIWENLGDSTFRLLDLSTTEDADISGNANVGMSFADWDLDGDPDLTFSDRFERNDFAESGEKRFRRIETEASYQNASPAWFDWDHDGDLDIAISTGGRSAQFFQSTLYDDVAPQDRKYLRVRPVGDSDDHPGGVDTEFAATVEVHISGERPEVRRRQFTASGHGYLNQSEYALTFGLEGVEAPRADISVDFVDASPDGAWRIDKHINPALGDIDVLGLLDREVRVLRSGSVVIEGVLYPPLQVEQPRLQTPGGIWNPTSADGVEDVDSRWVGLEVQVPVDTDGERGAAIREVLVEGQLAAGVACGDVAGNVLLWDVTNPDAELVGGATGAVSGDNRRVDVPTDFALRPGHTYRVLARVSATRSFVPADNIHWLTVRGSLSLSGDPCDPAIIGAAGVQDGTANMTVRYRERAMQGDPEDTEDTDTKSVDPSGPAPAQGNGCGCYSSTEMSFSWAPLLILWGARRRSQRPR